MAKAKKPKKKSAKISEKEYQAKISETMEKIHQINQASREKMRRLVLIAVLGNVLMILVFLGIVFLLRG